MREKVIFLSFISNVSKNGALRFPSRQKLAADSSYNPRASVLEKLAARIKNQFFFLQKGPLKLVPRWTTIDR